jgi:hypothetical protein
MTRARDFRSLEDFGSLGEMELYSGYNAVLR